LNCDSSEKLDRGSEVNEDFAVRDIAEGSNLLPIIKIAPNERNHAEYYGSRSVYVMSEVNSSWFHFTISAVAFRSECFSVICPAPLKL